MEKSNKIHYGPTQIGKIMSRVTSSTIKKRSHTESVLLSSWVDIVSSEISSKTYPVKISYTKGKKNTKTLHIAVAPENSTMISHMNYMIIEFVNMHFGYNAIDAIKLVPYSRVDEPVAKKSKRKAVNVEISEKELCKIKDSGLYNAIKDFLKNIGE